jgi:hypothetical protein
MGTDGDGGRAYAREELVAEHEKDTCPLGHRCLDVSAAW